MGDNLISKIIYPLAPPSDVQKPGPADGKTSSEDNKNSLWFAHDPAIFRDPISKRYYAYNTEAKAWRSDDLISWTCIGKVIDGPSTEAYEWTKSNAIWAPDIIKTGDEYRLYCSNSSWGSQQSAIFLAVADNPEGPFAPRGIVVKTNNETPVNAIDANIIEDAITGEQYMVYGSFWGGCYVLKLNADTGLADGQGVGTYVARRPLYANGAIEGPYIRYNSDTGYYYLFVSYGYLGSDYNIRVGRSQHITGPYLDPNGREMTDTEDESFTVGLMIACGYRFMDGQAYMAPGHNSVLKDDDGSWYLVCHIREYDYVNPQIAMMHVYKMFWTPNGWPVISPERYAGEIEQAFSRENLPGTYERIKLNPLVPQTVLNSAPMRLLEDGHFECFSLAGTWILNDEMTVTLSYGTTNEVCRISAAWDWQKCRPTIIITGIDNHGICVWGKKISDL